MTSETRTPAVLSRRLLATLGVAGILVASVIALTPSASALAVEETIVLDRHHTDAVSVRYENDTLVLKTRADLDSGAGQILDPARVLFHVGDELQDTVPDLPDFSFLGEAGRPIWKISQTYRPGALWAGWETQSLPRGEFAGETVRLRLDDVTGPGAVELYVNDVDGPRRLLSSVDPDLRTIVENVGAHTHANWVFTAPGEYAVTFVAEADRVSGGTIVSSAQTYSFVVGARTGAPEPSPSASEPVQPPSTDAPEPSPTPEVTRSAEPAPPVAAGESVATDEAAEQCIAMPVTTTVRPDNVDVVTSGHFDFGPVKEGGTLRPLVKDDRTAPVQWIDPATLVFHLGDAAASPAPGGQFGFLGSGQVWQIPLTQQAGVPWLGWNTQHPTIAGRTQGQVSLTLDGLEGPGDLAVYSVDSWGQLGTRHFGTVDGFPRSTSIDVGAGGVHVHGIWAFTQPGAYYADLTFAGTIDGQRISGTSTLTFFAGAGDPRSAVREQTVTTYVGRTADGAECRLSLAATGQADDRQAADLAGLGGAALVIGLAFLGAAALAPRRGTPRRRTS